MIRKILLNNDILIQTKQHILPITYGIVNSIFLIEVLLLLNYVNSSVNLGQGIIYERVILFYNIVIMTLFILVYILTPVFSAGSITSIAINNKLINLQVSGISPNEIVIEKNELGIMNVLFCIIVALPIGYISLFFGGINIVKIIKIMIVLLSYIVLYNTLCIMISSYNDNIIISFILSYLIGILIIIPLLLLLNLIITNNIVLIIYLIMSIVISIIFYSLSIKGTNFKNY